MSEIELRFREKCERAGLKVEEVIVDIDETQRQHCGWTVTAPDASGSAHIYDEDLAPSLTVQFQDWRPIPGYDAMFNPQNGTIEAAIEIVFHRHLDRDPFTDVLRTLNLNQLPIVFPTARQPGQSGIEVSIDWATPELMFWRTASPALHSIDDKLTPSVLIKNLPLGFDPVGQLESLGNAALWQLWRATTVLSRLQRHAPSIMMGFEAAVFEGTRRLEAPTTAPVSTPFELFVHGGMETDAQARFMSFYRTLEFYFPQMGRARVLSQLRARGSTVPEETIQELIDAGVISIRDNEERLLVELLQAVLPQTELESFIDRNPKRKVYYFEKSGLSRRQLHKDLGAHLYKQRCALVHTKEKQVTILPTGPNVADLTFDAKILRFAAAYALQKFARDVDG